MRRLATAIALGLAAALASPLAAAAGAHDVEGRRLFESKQCGRCHVPGGRDTGAPALEELRRPQGAWELTGRLWNHVPAMFTALRTEQVPWPSFTADEMRALMGYLAAEPTADAKPDAGRGLAVLVQKGCLKCHALHGEGGRIAPDLADRVDAFSAPAAWAARIWRHTPSMAAVAMERGVMYPRFTDHEMAHLVAYLKSSRRAK
jgi:cytochrome c551/c552